MTQSTFDQDKAGQHGPYEPPAYKQLAFGIGLSIFGIGAVRDSNATLAILLLAAGGGFIVLAARSFLAARRGRP